MLARLASARPPGARSRGRTEEYLGARASRRAHRRHPSRVRSTFSSPAPFGGDDGTGDGGGGDESLLDGFDVDGTEDENLLTTALNKAIFEEDYGLAQRASEKLKRLQGMTDPREQLLDWRSLGMANWIASRGEDLGFRYPTAIQRRASLAMMNVNDIVISSQTGSGKTLAYALPVVADLMRLDPEVSRGDGTVALVVAPTRELGVQISEVFDALTRRVAAGRLVAGAITGGEKRKAEKARLRKGVPVLVATPGRLLDHLRSTACLSYERLAWVVLDEVDRLLDLGFGPQVGDIMKKLTDGAARRPSKVLVTATVTAQLKDLAQTHLHAGFATVEAAKDEDAQESRIATPATLSQAHAIVTLKLRPAALCAMLRE